MVKICLTMIVKNESAIIRRCLDCSLKALDYIFILDTGSTDDTLEVVADWSSKNSIQCKVAARKFTNFGESRTLSALMAKEAFPDADYLLLLDADFKLEVSPNFSKDSLTKGYYLVEQRSNTIKYWNIRLIKTSLDWNCIGVTHEYWSYPNTSSGERLRTLSIDDRGDGGCKADKFTRDAALLEEGIKNPSTSPSLKGRYMFYLGQTLKDMGKFEESIEWYKKRILQGGPQEEIYYSYYQIGCSYKRLNRKEMALANYLEAWEKRPSRAEALYACAKMYRLMGKNLIAWMFCEKLEKIPDGDNLLFVDFRIKEYLLDYEMGILGYYQGDQENKKKGLDAINRILSKENIPDYIVKSSLENKKFYL